MNIVSSRNKITNYSLYSARRADILSTPKLLEHVCGEIDSGKETVCI